MNAVGSADIEYQQFDIWRAHGHGAATPLLLCSGGCYLCPSRRFSSRSFHRLRLQALQPSPTPATSAFSNVKPNIEIAEASTQRSGRNDPPRHRPDSDHPPSLLPQRYGSTHARLPIALLCALATFIPQTITCSRSRPMVAKPSLQRSAKHMACSPHQTKLEACADRCGSITPNRTIITGRSLSFVILTPQRQPTQQQRTITNPKLTEAELFEELGVYGRLEIQR